MYQTFNSKHVVRMLHFDTEVKKDKHFSYVCIRNQKEGKRNIAHCLGKLFSINDL